MPLQATSGAASYDGFGGGVAVVPNYIEDVFSTWLYTGNGSTQTITNGIDLSTKGGLVWVKSRSNATRHELVDTNRGTNSGLYTNNTDAAGTNPSVFNFLSTGFQVGVGIGNGNENAYIYASWTFRKQPKFFDVVTYTGNATAGRAISHSLGSVPGCIIVRGVDFPAKWRVWHRAVNGGQARGQLENTAAFITTDAQNYWGNNSTYIAPTSTNFTVSDDVDLNAIGQTFVAYIFAHDAGGFGLTGTDNVISCGSYTGNGSTTGPTITLGYEPQWVMIKNASSTGDWVMQDVMRGMPVGGNTMTLFANLSNAETDPGISRVQPTATGFQIANTASASLNASGNTYIYIAIRRGPMKTPTTGTSVYSGVARTGTGAAATISGVDFPPDLIIGKPRTGYSVGTAQFTRLLGTAKYLAPSWTDAEIADSTMVTSFNMDGVSLGADTTQRYFNGSSGTYINWLFRRATGFFDVVCYTGTGANLTLNHNLGVAPELIITKRRNGATYGAVYASSLGVDKYLELFSSSSGGRSAAQTFSGSWLTPTSTTFGVGVTDQNLSAATYVAYLFSTVAGVSKVGSYTGNGSSQTINCGFTGGARFVLIKKTSGTGDWVVFDSARGIVSGNDPFLELNTTAAEQTGEDAVDTDSTGFVVNETTESLNANGGTYIFLAIA
jgi:hypothetical protein